MPRILTVDDSRPIRMIVSKALVEMGFEVGEAEDGNDGLKKLQAGAYDLVVLDVTMPNLDGPGMLAKMREAGDKTPVLMLTSESKTSIVAALMKLGIQDYVLKPFKGDELRAKVLKALKLPADYVAQKSGAAAGADAGDGKLIVLVIDDMENVHKKLRSMIPETVELETALSVQDGLNAVRNKKVKAILVDAKVTRFLLPRSEMADREGGPGLQRWRVPIGLDAVEEPQPAAGDDLELIQRLLQYLLR